MSALNDPPDSGRRVEPGRRDALRTLGVLTLFKAASGCTNSENADPLDAIEGNCSAAPASVSSDWVEVPLALHPALRTPGSSEPVRMPEALLDVILLHTVEGCFQATWRICPHGACAVDYVPEARELRCPCHGSRFGEDGRLLQGPAARALTSFPAAQIGDSVFIKRQL